jgi:hypothetical protein
MLNVRPKPEEFCTKFPHENNDRKYHYPLVHKYSCFIKNDLAFGSEYGKRVDARFQVDRDDSRWELHYTLYPFLMDCFFENTLYKS